MQTNKVFLIGSYQPSLINFRKHLMLSLQSRGFDIYCLAPLENEETTQALSALGVHYINLPLSRTGFNPLKDLHTAFFLWQLFKKERPAYLITYTIKPVIYGNLAASFLPNITKLAWITGLGYLATGKLSNSKRIVQRLIFGLYKFSLRNLEYIAFQNPDDRSFFKKHKLLKSYTKQTITAGSGVDLNDFAKAPVQKSPIVFLLTARLIKAKGVEYFMHAAEQLKEKYKDQVEFHLIGMLDKQNPDAISEDLLQNLSKRGIINYLGFQKDVRDFLAKCSVFVLPSFYREGTPRTILEAMAMGKPIITTDNPGCRETVKKDINGFLIPTHDTASLAAKMEYFINNPEQIEIMGKNSYKLAVDKFDVNKVNDHLINFLLQ